MAKTKVSQYDATAANNTDVANINIAEGCSPSNINNAIRAVMGHLKDFQAGNVAGNALAVAGGGTGAETAGDARTNLGLGALSTLDTVDTAQIDDEAVTFDKLGFQAVGTTKILGSAITVGKIADGAVETAKIADDAVNATKLNVSGDGTSGQVLSSDGDGSFSWVDGVTGSNSGNGHIKFSNGLKVNWGYANVSASSSGTITFPSAFASAVYNIQTTATLTGVFNSEPLGVISSTTSNFVVSNSNAFNFGFYWIAIGV